MWFGWWIIGFNKIKEKIEIMNNGYLRKKYSLKIYFGNVC